MKKKKITKGNLKKVSVQILTNYTLIGIKRVVNYLYPGSILAWCGYLRPTFLELLDIGAEV